MLRAFANQAAWVWRHPLNSRDRPQSILRWLSWIVTGRLLGGRIYRWVDDTRFHARPGQHGITRCISGRLDEPQQMGFALHYLRPGETFVDIGANAGSYSLLALAAGARAIAFEPDPGTHEALLRNFAINAAETQLEAYRCALSDQEGPGFLTGGLGVCNHLAEAGTPIELRTLDGVMSGRQAALVKIDVEGAEAQVIRGGMETLRRCPAAIVELLDHGRRYGDGDNATHALLSELGFHPAHYDPLARKLIPLDGPDPDSHNTIYLRDLDAARSLVESARRFDVLGREI